MKRHLLHPVLLVMIAVGAILAPCMPTLAQQQMEFTYIYDQSGRLVRAIDSTGNVLTYTYDAAGNLLSITRTKVEQLGPPTIISVTPNSFTISPNEQIALVVEGTNLLGADVTTNNPGPYGIRSDL